MSYVQRVLQPGETIRYIASIHWIIYWPGTSFLMLGLVTLFYGEFFSQHMLFWQVIAGLFVIVGIVLLLPEWFAWWTTEIAVTNLRVIYKTELIQRRTKEMNMDKVESVQVDQSIPGRLLDFGTVSIIGTGESVEKLQNVAKPIDLRNHITAADRSK